MKIKQNCTRLLTLLFSSSLLLAISCDNNPPTETQVNNTEEETTTTTVLTIAPPIKNLDIPFTPYQISGTTAQTITTPSGSTISIPANAFLDENNQPISGEVTIEFREFHTAADIIASGIPIHNPATGEVMETAGMFEIKGHQNGKEIFVKADKDIAVNLASYNDGDKFNFYALSPKDCSWDDLGTAAPTPNEERAKELSLLDKEIAEVEQQKRLLQKPSNYVFEFDLNATRFPELKSFKNLLWEYANQGPDPKKEDWIFDVNWDNVTLDAAGVGSYQINLVSSTTNQTFTTYVQPVLSPADRKEVAARYQKNIETITARQEATRLRLESIAKIQRAFNINGFGIYNWDHWGNPGTTRVQPEILVNNEPITDKEHFSTAYFLVMTDVQGIFRYNAENLHNLRFDPAVKNILLAIQPNGDVAYFSAAKFQTLDTKSTTENGTVTLNLVKSDLVVSDVTDLDAVIALATAT